MQSLLSPLDVTGIGKLAQHAIECRPVGILGAKGARDLARAYLAGAFADEGEKLLAGGEGIAFHVGFMGRSLAALMAKDRKGARCENYSAACVVLR
jgi:hypothetical protein